MMPRILGGLQRVKAYSNRETAMNWGGLAHNPWKLAEKRKDQAEERERETRAEAA